jgi:hypothetical protein
LYGLLAFQFFKYFKKESSNLKAEDSGRVNNGMGIGVFMLQLRRLSSSSKFDG